MRSSKRVERWEKSAACEWPTANLNPALLLPRNLSNESEQFNLQHSLPEQSLHRLRRRRAAEEQRRSTTTDPVRCTHGARFDLGDVDAYFQCVSAEMDGHSVENGGSSAPEEPSASGSADLPSDTDTAYSEDFTVGAKLGQSESGDDFDSPSLNGSSGAGSTSTLSEDSGSADQSWKPDHPGKLLLRDGAEGEVDSRSSDDNPEDLAGAASLTPSSSAVFEDREFDFLKAEPVRRSTSLKTYKTPPGTPHKKKGVRFADALGLDLESVRHILNLEDPPTVPKSAMKDLKIQSEPEEPRFRAEGTKYLAAYFPQPGADPGFFNRVASNKVVLENCIVHDKEMTVSGTIRVANIAFHKTVIVRYSINNWLTSVDICASYIQNSNDGPTDRFSFTITVPQYFSVGSRLQFAIMYSTNGATYWDNNNNNNYNVECYAKAVPTGPSDNSWVHFL